MMVVAYGWTQQCFSYSVQLRRAADSGHIKLHLQGLLLKLIRTLPRGTDRDRSGRVKNKATIFPASDVPFSSARFVPLIGAIWALVQCPSLTNLHEHTFGNWRTCSTYWIRINGQTIHQPDVIRKLVCAASLQTFLVLNLSRLSDTDYQWLWSVRAAEALMHVA